jgi:hypothetical protein
MTSESKISCQQPKHQCTTCHPPPFLCIQKNPIKMHPPPSLQNTIKQTSTTTTTNTTNTTTTMDEHLSHGISRM